MSVKKPIHKHSTCILIGRAYREVYRRARVALADHGLGPAQYILLATLWEKDGQSGAELGASLGLDSASMTGLLDRAVSHDLVRRRSDASDRRVSRIWLTDKGGELETSVGAIMGKFDRELAARVDGDMAYFKAQLDRLGDFG